VYNVIIVIYDNVTNMSSTHCPGYCNDIEYYCNTIEIYVLGQNIMVLLAKPRTETCFSSMNIYMYVVIINNIFTFICIINE